MNNDKQITVTVGELDKFLFEEVIAAIKPFPEDHRAALRIGMAIVDNVMAKFDDVAKKAARSEAAKKAVAARWSPPAPPQNPGAEPVPAEFADPSESPTAGKRRRRTKAEMEAARAGAPVLQPRMNPNPEEVAAMAPTLEAPVFTGTETQVNPEPFPPPPPFMPFALPEPAAVVGEPTPVAAPTFGE